MRKLSMYQKIIFSFLIIIVGIYFSFAYFWFSSQKEVEKNRVQLIESQVQFTLIAVNEKLEQVRMEQKNLLNNEYLKYLANTSFDKLSFDTIKAYNNLQLALISIRNKLDYMSAVEVYMPSHNKKICSNVISDMSYNTYRSLIINEFSGFTYHTDEEQIAVHMYSDFFVEHQNKNEFLPLYYMKFYIDSIELNRLVNNILPSESVYAFVSNESKKCIFANKLDLYSSTMNDDTLIYTQDSDYGEKYMRFTAKLDKLTLFVDIPTEFVNPGKNHFKNGLILFSGVSMLLLLFFALFTRRIIYSSLNKLMTAFKTVEAGDFEHTVLYNKRDEFAFLFSTFNSMINHIRFLISEVYVQKINRQKSELKQLQYQINPHFLYNTLAILYRMIKFNDDEGAAKMSRYLSEYYQYITRTGTDTVPLLKEYEHTLNYIEIQKMRFPDIENIFISELPEEFVDLHVPRLILQPIIENAFKYGLVENGAGGIIEIRFEQNKEYFIISICDNGGKVNGSLIQEIENKLLEQNSAEAYTGLINVHKRLELHFGATSGVKLSINSWGGLCCALYLEVV